MDQVRAEQIAWLRGASAFRAAAYASYLAESTGTNHSSWVRKLLGRELPPYKATRGRAPSVTARRRQQPCNTGVWGGGTATAAVKHQCGRHRRLRRPGSCSAPGFAGRATGPRGRARTPVVGRSRALAGLAECMHLDVSHTTPGLASVRSWLGRSRRMHHIPTHGYMLNMPHQPHNASGAAVVV
jgi:hypothetical protein